MKNKHNSFFKNPSIRPSSLMKFKNPPSIKPNNILYKTKYNSPDKEIESSNNIQKNNQNNKKGNNNTQKHQFSYYNFLAPIFNLKQKTEKINKNQTLKNNNLILTSFNNATSINIPKKEEKILPYEYNDNNCNIKNTKKSKKKQIKKDKIYFMNNISLLNFASLKKNKKKNTKKRMSNKTPDNNVISKLNSEKRNNQRKKNYFLTSLRSKKNSSRGKSEKNKEREKDISNIMKKLNILNLKHLPKPYYSTKVEYLSNKSNNSKTKYGINQFIDYLKGANLYKYNKINSINKNVSISSLGNVSFRKILTSKNKNPKTPKNSKLKINPNLFSIKNISAIQHTKNKKMNSIEHKKTKSINFGPQSYPCFNCFFNIINDNNNLKYKTNNITIDMNYNGRSKKKVFYFSDKNNNNNNNNNNNLSSKQKNENKKQVNKNTINSSYNTNSNLVSNYLININNNINTKNNNKNNNLNLIQQKSNKIISQSQRDLVPIPRTFKRKNFTTKNTPTKILTKRLSTEQSKNKNKLNKNIQDNILNSSSTSKINDYNYYMEQSIQLSNYIKNYYKNHHEYPSTKINFYNYGRLIGQGAFGKVNIGLNVLTGRIVAIKSFIKDDLKNSDNMNKILYETNLMRKLNHPNITKILETFEDDKYIFIIMEYINGGNLFSFVKKRRKLSEKISKFLFRQIIEGIQHIHSKKIVHRDIKLENILIDLNNRIKICDFGIGITLDSEDELIREQCGTPMYMAPEIILNSKKNGYKGYPVDIWSAGIALYIMLSGTLPFSYKNKDNNKEINDENNNSKSLSNNNNYDLQYSIVNKNPKKIKKISPEARNLLHGLLNKDPTKRLTIEEILNHPWLKKDKNCKKYKLFTKAERIMLEKNFIDYRIKGNEDLKESFSISNLESNEKNKDLNNMKNEKTKSTILAPYNTLIENESFRINEDGETEFDNGEKFSDFNNKNIKMENDIINIGHNVKQAFINFEFNNNGELDNGMIIQSKSKSNTFINLSYEDSSSDENNNENNEYNSDVQNEEKINKILNTIENFGYDKKYVKKCLDNNILCYATTVYYLLVNYGNF